jgi:hypothetical protein
MDLFNGRDVTSYEEDCPEESQKPVVYGNPTLEEHKTGYFTPGSIMKTRLVDLPMGGVEGFTHDSG